LRQVGEQAGEQKDRGGGGGGTHHQMPEIRDARSHSWGRMTEFVDPFGHRFCLIEFSSRAYDAIVID
jgi:hypothetical protein